MGILPLEFTGDATAATLGLTGHEVIDIEGIADGIATNFSAGRKLAVKALRPDGTAFEFMLVRV